MLTRVMPSLVLLAAAMVASLAPQAAAQADGGTVFKAGLKPGAEMNYSVGQRMRIDQRQTRPAEEEGAAPVATAVSESFAQAARVQLKVDSVAADGAAVVNARVTDLVLFARTQTRTARFVGGPAAGSLELAGDDDVKNSEDDEGLGAIGKALMDAEIRLSVDASGAVTEVAGLDGMMEALAAQQSFTLGGENPVPDSRVAGIFGAENVGDVLTRLFQVDGANTTARRQGAAWQTERVIPIPPVGAIGITHNWSFDSLNEGTATLNGVMSMEIRRAENVPETVATVELGEHEGKTVVLWDTAAGALVRRTTRQEVGSVWKLGTLTVTQSQSTLLDLQRD